MKDNHRNKIWVNLFRMLTISLLCMLVYKVNVFASTGTVTLENGKFYSANYQYPNKYIHKIIIPADGYIKITGYATIPGSSIKRNMSIMICDSNQKALTKNPSYMDKFRNPANVCYYGVKKGTYYIRTEYTSGNKYHIKYNFTKIKAKRGSTKSKAITLKSGVYSKGLITIGESKNKVDWYKFTINKTRKVKINFDTKLAGNTGLIFDFSFTKTRYATIFVAKGGPKTITLRPGTYYVKVSRLGDKPSGYYRLKFS